MGKKYFKRFLEVLFVVLLVSLITLNMFVFAFKSFAYKNNTGHFTISDIFVDDYIANTSKINDLCIHIINKELIIGLEKGTFSNYITEDFIKDIYLEKTDNIIKKILSTKYEIDKNLTINKLNEKRAIIISKIPNYEKLSQDERETINKELDKIAMYLDNNILGVGFNGLATALNSIKYKMLVMLFNTLNRIFIFLAILLLWLYKTKYKFITDILLNNFYTIVILSVINTISINIYLKYLINNSIANIINNDIIYLIKSLFNYIINKSNSQAYYAVIFLVLYHLFMDKKIFSRANI